ncbi:MAG: hypothetical protein IPK39_05470 [Sulfuritalea sp.]|nr:hypothetical protein [Sulfuritalea sp.]
MIDPRRMNSFLATLYMTDFEASVTDSSANPYGVSVASILDGQVTVDNTWRHGPLLGSEVGEGLVRSPIAVAGGRIDVLGPYKHRYDIGGNDQTGSLRADANLCLFRGTVVDGATDGRHNFTIRRTGNGNLLSPTRTFIWQTGSFGGNGDALCELPIGDDESAFGITYDPFRQSLWVQIGPEFAVPGGAYRSLEVGLDGTVKSASTGPTIGLVGLLAGALTMDHEDRSLWWIQFGDLRLRQNISHVGLRFDRIGPRLSYFFLEPGTAAGAPCWPLRPIHGAEFEIPVRLPEPTSLSLFPDAVAAA